MRVAEGVLLAFCFSLSRLIRRLPKSPHTGRRLVHRHAFCVYCVALELCARATHKALFDL